MSRRAPVQRFYFLTYTLVPGRRPNVCITRIYGRAHALRVVRASMADYEDAFGSKMR